MEICICLNCFERTSREEQGYYTDEVEGASAYSIRTEAFLYKPISERRGDNALKQGKIQSLKTVRLQT